MKVDLFDFDLPSALIAQRPVTPRDSARLLAVGGDLVDCAVRDLSTLLKSGDLLVFNDTRVIPSRLKGKRTTASVEVTLHKRLSPGVWLAFARPARKLRPDDVVDFASDFSAHVVAKGEGGEVTLDFKMGDAPLCEFLARDGAMPLPPYIKRQDLADEKDGIDYQTMFADTPGAVAAPTAALHFTDKLMGQLKGRGINHTFLTLHVGAGTFLPVKTETTQDHVMHSEVGEITPEAANVINQTIAEGGRIIAVGSTSLRLMESAVDNNQIVQPFTGETDIFITPGYQFKTAHLMLTNFHLPRSTLFMLVSAFAGLERMQVAYQHAMDKGYRFYSYGDCCLLERT